jgi:hypothetical protein
MNPDTLGSTGPLESLTPHLDKICDRFEAALKAAGKSGPRPRIEDYLGDVPAAEWEAILPPPSNHCLRCGLDHDPPDTGRGQPVRRIILSYPAGGEDDGLGERGWRESDFRLDREGRREDV